MVPRVLNREDRQAYVTDMSSDKFNGCFTFYFATKLAMYISFQISTRRQPTMHSLAQHKQGK